MFAVVGCIERDGGTLYCTVLFFDGAQGLIGKHRKLMPTVGERLIWGFGDGSTMPVFETPLGRVGAVICWENYMPMYLLRGETDRDDEREVAVRNFGLRWRKWYSSLDQVERLGIENGRSKTLDDLAAYDFALPINCKRDTGHTDQL